MACGVIQAASAAVYSKVAAPLSLPAHLEPSLGEGLYRAIVRAAPLPFAEKTLAEIALNERRYQDAAGYARKLRPSPARSELEARIDQARGDQQSAVRLFLDASDITSVGAEVDRLESAGNYRAAYRLENALRERLLRTETHPDAVAESYWRSGVLAERVAPAEALGYFTKAHVLAPFSEKYLLFAGTQALALNKNSAAHIYFQQCIDLNPADADAYAGLGIAFLREGNPVQARALLEKSRSLDSRSKMLQRLKRELQ